MRKPIVASIAIALTIAGGIATAAPPDTSHTPPTATPIKHLVVIFQENVSFDHYFGTYPVAVNTHGEPPFRAKAGTPTVNGLSAALLSANPTATNPQNADGATNPFRLSRAEASTADQDHDYTPEQQAMHLGLMDLFPFYTGAGGTGSGAPPPPGSPGIFSTTGLVMGYYDGNTVTALWNYAQHYAMSDNSYNTTFGPSTPGALNLVSGQTNGVVATLNGTGDETDGGNGSLTMISDADPIGDVCSPSTGAQGTMGGQNVGDLLTAANVTWGFFSGGFDLTITNSDGSTGCSRTTTSAVTGVTKKDYIPHHQPFQYYASTANPTHARPSRVEAIGTNGDGANHQYDIHDFFDALRNYNLPAVSYLKAPGYQDGHAGYSDPLDEQTFVVHVLNTLMASPYWNSTAVVIAYDDSDGWYDHQMPPIVNQSSSPDDGLTGEAACGDGTTTSLPGIDAANAHAQGRCGYGPRLPLLLVSAWAKQNYVDHTLTDQSSILRFVEDNWLDGARLGGGSFDAITGTIEGMFDFNGGPSAGKLRLDENTGEPSNGHG
ncbi:MAG TPA: alkaline phosphatase family protein [Rhodanobacteraceae bacterium]|nr:alkaline phosphatase family protein [Rhodanobacteraceae bacterium]